MFAIFVVIPSLPDSDIVYLMCYAHVRQCFCTVRPQLLAKLSWNNNNCSHKLINFLKEVLKILMILKPFSPILVNVKWKQIYITVSKCKKANLNNVKAQYISGCCHMMGFYECLGRAIKEFCPISLGNNPQMPLKTVFKLESTKTHWVYIVAHVDVRQHISLYAWL